MKHAALLVAAGLLSVTASVTQAANYDGRWSVSIVTRNGVCDSYKWNLGIAAGKVTDVEGQTGASAGGIAANGKVDITVMRGSDSLTARGKANGATAFGTWTSPSRACSGTWQAAKI